LRSSILRPAATVAAAAAVVLGAVGSASASALADEYPPYPSKLILKSELRFKANLVRDNLAGSPELVFFGGSRSQRFDPVFARRATGLRSVNVAESCDRPEAAWGMLNWFYAKWPDAKIRWVWGMQSGMMRNLDLDPALLQDPRFYQYFPDDLLDAQRARLPQTVRNMPRQYAFLRNKYSALGLCTWNTYDKRFALGLTLDASLDAYIARMLRDGNAKAAAPGLQDSRARSYFEKTVEVLNEHGTTPIIILMPIHPRVLRVMRSHDMGGERQELREYLAEFGKTAQLRVLDLTTIRSFNGRPGWFYDGVHISRGNANRVILAIKRQAGDCLK
jgi:hypothetical protein